MKNKSELSYDAKSIITVLLLLFLYPIGLILMYVWTRWNIAVKLLITIPLFLIIFALYKDNKGLKLNVNDSIDMKKYGVETADDYNKKSEGLQDPDKLILDNAYLYYSTKNNRKAIEEFNKYLEIHPDFVDGYYYLHFSYLRVGERDKAKEALQKALELEPKGTDKYKKMLEDLKGL